MDADTRAYLDQILGDLRDDFRREFGTLRQEFGTVRQEFGSLRGDFGELRQEVRDTAMETRRHFHVIAEDLRDDVRGIAEGVIALSDRVDRMDASLRAEMNERFTAAHAVVRVAFGQVRRDLDNLRFRL